MKKWYAKELSQLTHVSVRTLHHYDKIGLLTPSMRLPNGYRLYSETDLLKLQQIIALKFLGFELAQIKLLLLKQEGMVENFAIQAKCLEEKAKAFQEASSILKHITTRCSGDKSIPWEHIIQLIEVYHMTQQLEHSWVKELFTPDELKQYAEFEKEMNDSGHKNAFKKAWQHLVDELKANLQHDPYSKIGIELGKKYMDWVNEVYGKKYAHLRTKKWEQGFGEGKGLDEVGLTPEQMMWVEKAVDAYWRDRISSLLHQIGAISSVMALAQWDAILDEMYGNDAVTKKERQGMIIEMALNEGGINLKAKEWLENLSKSSRDAIF